MYNNSCTLIISAFLVFSATPLWVKKCSPQGNGCVTAVMSEKRSVANFSFFASISKVWEESFISARADTSVFVPCCQKREQKLEQTNGLPERPASKRSSSPAVELELNAGPLRLDGLPPGAGAAGPGLRVAQVRLLDRRTSSRPSSRPGTPNSNTSSTPTPSEEQNDGEEEAAEADDDIQGAELESATLSAPTPRLLKRPFQLLIAAAMERNPTQFQLPSELTCTTALPGQSSWRHL